MSMRVPFVAAQYDPAIGQCRSVPALQPERGYRVRQTTTGEAFGPEGNMTTIPTYVVSIFYQGTIPNRYLSRKPIEFSHMSLKFGRPSVDNFFDSLASKHRRRGDCDYGCRGTRCWHIWFGQCCESNQHNRVTNVI
jgi:hypothetical protein